MTVTDSETDSYSIVALYHRISKRLITKFTYSLCGIQKYTLVRSVYAFGFGRPKLTHRALPLWLSNAKWSSASSKYWVQIKGYVTWRSALLTPLIDRMCSVENDTQYYSSPSSQGSVPHACVSVSTTSSHSTPPTIGSTNRVLFLSPLSQGTVHSDQLPHSPILHSTRKVYRLRWTSNNNHKSLYTHKLCVYMTLVYM